MKKYSLFVVLVCTIFSMLVTGCKKDPVPPAVSTAAVSDITLTSAKAGGDIIDDGGAGVTEKGVAYGLSPEPTADGTHVNAGQGSSAFTVDLVNLTEGTKYYVRAYATNSAGTAYGEQQSFTTVAATVPNLTTKSVTGITYTSAASGGEIATDGGSQITAKGIVMGTEENPAVDGKTNVSITNDGTGTEAFNSSLTGLSEGTTYYVRAYATNAKGTAYGNQVTFTTTAVLQATVETKPVTGITASGAVTGGNITADNGSAVTAKGVAWGTTENPTIAGSHTTNGSGNETFNSTLTGLAPATTYFVRAYATNSKGTSYGNQVSFTTGATAPTLTTRPVTDVTFSSARTGGDVTSNGGSPVTAKGVVWGKTENPTVEGSRTTDGTGNEGFVSNLTGLDGSTTYYARAYATNSAGTAYGNQVSFTTAAALPTLTTRPVTDVTFSTARTGGDITSGGGSPVTAKGVVWGKTQNPTVSGSRTTDGTGNAGFVSNLTGLDDTTTYYARAYATNGAGTAYGNQVTFTTRSSSAPVVTTAAVSAVTSNSATTGGNVTASGGLPVTQRGVAWGLQPNPTIAGNRTTNGTGTGAFTSSITGPANGTVYYARAYATNSKGTSYGNQVTFITGVADIDNNVYRTVKIGNQVWMAENLKTTRFRNNTPIPQVTGTAQWIALDTLRTPAYTWYGNAPANKDTYGGIYNWYAVGTGNLCPAGWHVPTEAEYQTMERTIGVPADSLGTWGFRGNNMGTHLKSTTGWTGGNGDNTTGFTALPAGYRAWVDGTFRGAGTIVYFWTATDDAVNAKPDLAWYRRLDATDHRIYKATTRKGGGKSIRCIKD